jgi:hypothetical protein
MGNAQPIFVSNDIPEWPEPVPTPAGTITDLLFENISAVSENGVYIKGRLPAAGEAGRASIRELRFVNVNVVIQQRPKNSGSNGPHPSRSDRQELRAAAAVRRVPATADKVDAYFIEHASDVTFHGCSAAFDGPPMPGNEYGRCIALGNGTSGIVPPKLDSCRTRSEIFP